MIIGCAHHSGMGLCSTCDAEVERNVKRDFAEREKRHQRAFAEMVNAESACSCYLRTNGARCPDCTDRRRRFVETYGETMSVR